MSTPTDNRKLWTYVFLCLILLFLCVCPLQETNAFQLVNTHNKFRSLQSQNEQQDDDQNTVLISSSREYQKGDDDVIDKNQKDGENSTVSNNSKQEVMTHFCFLVHGYRGNPNDLSYLESVMIKAGKEALLSTTSTTLGTKGSEGEENEKGTNEIVLHKCQCNLNRTNDGVERGGRRVMDEILHVIRQHADRHCSTRRRRDDEIIDVTLSIVGNSLGGLYSRYAIAKLAEMGTIQQIKKKENSQQVGNGNDEIVIDGKIRIHLNLFCTTATPHLGISGHTYVPLSRQLETFIGHIMGHTGRDIFRVNTLLKTMCTCPTFLEPLASFQKRIAYANAYHTDFVVPTETAAFLHHESTSCHHAFECPNDELMTKSVEDIMDGGMIVATLHTPRQEVRDYTSFENNTSTLSSNGIGSNFAHNDDLLKMSTALDQLGWEKVFVDVRRTLPTISMPHWMEKILTIDSSRQISSIADLNKPATTEQTRVLKSSEVAQSFTHPQSVIPFPIGHNMMVAVSTGKIQKSIFKGGQPLMDMVGRKLMHDILDWNLKNSK